MKREHENLHPEITPSSLLKETLDFYEKNDYLQGNLLVYQGERVLFEKSYGLANIEMSIPFHSGTKFKIGSLTKAFSSMLTFILQEKHLLNIDEPVNHYIKGIAPDDSITICHCLTCSSGIPDFTEKKDYWHTSMRQPHTIEEILQTVNGDKLQFAPGSAYAYSSTGYLIVTRIIEAVTGKEYHECLRKFILEPLGMMDSGCMTETGLVSQLSSSYDFWEQAIRTPETNMSFPAGAFGMYSTIGDLLKWGQAILERQLISGKLYQRYLSAFQGTYACGWDIASIAEHKCYQHRGDIDGFVSSIKMFDEPKTIIIFLSNLKIIPAPSITKEIAESLLGITHQRTQKDEEILNKELAKQLSGNYSIMREETKEKGTLHLDYENEKLFITVAKRYGSIYKYELFLTRQKQMLILKSRHINETITLSADMRAIRYKNAEGTVYTLEKKGRLEDSSTKKALLRQLSH